MADTISDNKPDSEPNEIISEIDKKVKPIINELYTTEAGVYNDMRDFVKDYETIAPGLATHLSSTEYAQLEFLMKPYQEFAESAVVLENSQSDATTAERLKLLSQQLAKPEFITLLKTFAEVSNNLDMMRDLLTVIAQKESIQKDPTLYAVKYEAKGIQGSSAMTSEQLTILDTINKKFVGTISKPMQRGPRYELLLEAIDKGVVKANAPEEIQQLVKETFAALKGNLEVLKKLEFLTPLTLKEESSRVLANRLAAGMGDFFIGHIATMTADLDPNLINETSSQIRQLDRLAEQLEITNDAQGNFKSIMQFYADAYLDDRDKGLKGMHIGTVKGRLLTSLENAISKHLVEDRSNVTTEEVIFNAAGGIPSIRDTQVAHLFQRAMTDGIVLQNQQMFINAIKAVVRMGNGAINEWNRLASHMDNGKAFKLDATTYDPASKSMTSLKENQLAAMFEVSRETKDEVLNLYIFDVFISILKNTDRKELSTQQLDTLDTLISHLAERKTGETYHRDFIRGFTNVYVDERKKDAKDGNLLTHLMDSVTKFHEVTGSSMFLGYKYKPDHMDAAIISSIEKYKENNKTLVVEDLMIRALAAANRGKKDPTARQEFVNCVKAIVRMKAVPDWDNLAVKYVNSKLFSIMSNADMIKKPMIGKQFGEAAINKFYDKITESKEVFTLKPEMLRIRENREWSGKFEKRSLLSEKPGFTRLTSSGLFNTRTPAHFHNSISSSASSEKSTNSTPRKGS